MSGQAPDRNVRPPVDVNLDAEIARLELTNDAVARYLEVPERQVRRWRNGETTPSWAVVVAFARLFEREPAWFYIDHGDEPTKAAA